MSDYVAGVAPDTGSSCRECGGQLAEGDSFCTGCGAPVAAERTRVGSRRHLVVTIAIALVSVLAAGTLTTLWLAERSAHSKTRDALSTAELEVATLSREKSALESKLAETERLASRRAALLARAAQVTKGIDPLLNSVDELKVITGRIQDSRDSYATASAELTSDLIALGSYLVSTDPYYVSTYYVNSLIDEINDEIDTVRYYAAQLDGHDADYGSATRRFDTRANALSEAVRRLQRELREAT